MPDLAASILAALDAKSDEVYWLYRATVETLLDLHEPVSNEEWAPGSREHRTVCGECSPGEDDYYDRPYPCRTVRAIAEKLGVEVPDGRAPV